MQQILILSAAAGFASALLYGALTPGWMLLAPLLFIAPAPLITVGIGWHPLVAALGALFGCIGVSFLSGSKLALSFGLLIGLPAWLIAYGVVYLMRTMPAGTSQAAAGRVIATYVLGGIAVFSALAMVGGAMAISADYATFEAQLAGIFQRMLTDFSRMQNEVPDPAGIARMSRTFIRIFVPMSATIIAMALTFSLWISIRFLGKNGRLPFVTLPAYTIAFSKDVLFWLVGALLVAQTSGFIGLLGSALAGTIGFMLMLNGLALLHARTLGQSGRPLMLWLAWAILIFFAPAALIFSIAGLADALFDLRQAGGGSSNPQS